MDSKDGGLDVESILDSELGELGGAGKLHLHNHWGHVYRRWNRGSGSGQGLGFLTLAIPIPEVG